MPTPSGARRAPLVRIVRQEPARCASETVALSATETRVLRVDLRIADRMKGDAVAMGFFYFLKVCFYFSLFFGGPVLLWQMWAFIAAGLY